MEYMKFTSRRRQTAMTLPEVLIALLLLGLFLPSYKNGSASWHYDCALAAEGERIYYRLVSYLEYTR
jgi:prepilin-type N-terminal cleavage/methylation domain-containing protein